jgi:hypothetical protein
MLCILFWGIQFHKMEEKHKCLVLRIKQELQLIQKLEEGTSTKLEQ